LRRNLSAATSLHDHWKVEFIVPSHCTGEPAFAKLKERFGDKYVYAGLGSTVVPGPQIVVKAEIGHPVQRAMDAEDYRSYRLVVTQGPLRALLGRPPLAVR
jgi:7,8-dihydropterin-6-yl-methyl-4-(beta-D-ribofuranosyl)aminobenzene 5'-phosphate synthase